MLERISRREEFDLLVAWIAISVAFAIIFLRGAGRADPLLALSFLAVSLFTVGIGFIFHEMAHKFTAIKYGFWAEFRKDNIMLVVAVALAALVGVVFAAPGATVIYDTTGRGISREQNGKISVAGPLVNLLLCIPFAGLLLYGGEGYVPDRKFCNNDRYDRFSGECDDCSIQHASCQCFGRQKGIGLEQGCFYCRDRRGIWCPSGIL